MFRFKLHLQTGVKMGFVGDCLYMHARSVYLPSLLPEAVSGFFACFYGLDESEDVTCLLQAHEICATRSKMEDVLLNWLF